MPDSCVVFARKARLRALWRPLLLLAVMAALVWWFVDAASERYRWQWYRVWRYIGVWDEGTFHPGVLLEALGVTFQLTLASLALSLVWGAVLAAMRLSVSPVSRLLSSLMLGLLRNTPLLMQLFMVYFVAAPVLGVGPFTAAVLALGLFEGAYIAEIFRAGLMGVPRGQESRSTSNTLPPTRPATCTLAIHGAPRSAIASRTFSMPGDTTSPANIT